MFEAKTPLETIGKLSELELKTIKEKGITSVEDLLAKIKSYNDSLAEIARLLGIREDRIPFLVKEARGKVTKEFLKMLDSQFDPDQFYFGALPPEEENNN